MREKSILIIGAGIGGLAAGCYAQMNGYTSCIFEMHALPGGVCTSFSPAAPRAILAGRRVARLPLPAP
ncbi:MAG: NAD(P)-binding protein [Chloroflexi bacterium]|nr:NAD(P)-binding protein [Chloroflexota bacterium]